MSLSYRRGWRVILIITLAYSNSNWTLATISVQVHSASTLVNQTRTTLWSVATVATHKISIVSPAEGSSASAVTFGDPRPSRPVRDI